jgi:hypothetical protein
MARLWADSSFQYVRFADHADLDASTALTFMSWVYPTSVASSDFQHIISKWNSYALRLMRTGDPDGFRVTIFIGSSQKSASSGALPTLNQWYHLTGVYDGTTLRLRVYDSVADTVTNYDSAQSGNIDTGTELLYLGTFQGDLSAARYNGRIANVQMWKDVALSDAEIDGVRRRFAPHRTPEFMPPILGLDDPEPDWSGKAHSSAAISGTAIANGPPVLPMSGRFWGDMPLAEAAGGVVVPALDEGMHLGGMQPLSGGIAA